MYEESHQVFRALISEPKRNLITHFVFPRNEESHQVFRALVSEPTRNLIDYFVFPRHEESHQIFRTLVSEPTCNLIINFVFPMYEESQQIFRALVSEPTINLITHFVIPTQEESHQVFRALVSEVRGTSSSNLSLLRLFEQSSRVRANEEFHKIFLKKPIRFICLYIKVEIPDANSYPHQKNPIIYFQKQNYFPCIFLLSMYLNVFLLHFIEYTCFVLTIQFILKLFLLPIRNNSSILLTIYSIIFSFTF